MLTADPPAPTGVIMPGSLESAARALEADQLVIMPTGRWYMICCNAASAGACAAVFAAKRRPVHKPLLLVLPTAFPLAAEFRIGPGARQLIEAFWPGDLALQLSWSAPPSDQPALSPLGDEVVLACRPPGLLGALADQARVPVAASSANISGVPGDGEGGAGPAITGARPAITAAQAEAFACGAGLSAAVLVDGGICAYNQHLTIVDCSDPDAPPRLARDGIVHRDAISAALAGLAS